MVNVKMKTSGLMGETQTKLNCDVTPLTQAHELKNHNFSQSNQTWVTIIQFDQK